ncbi:uncharacterized protein FIBRA_09618 [Fibroporia radiculosa]|uniref:Uncharacterized protein n=1 Tax=Fibroporia radiculosa TaxID=599839 RepID=J4GWQ0_9APHY|nr:uncharacterized protein FIBRA_09618 [Fibroporia radiculosa]CCM06145.1 predicted protein [Fibroporia radiculosa]
MPAIPQHEITFEQSLPFDIFEASRSHDDPIGIFWWQLYSRGSTSKTKPHHPEIETYDTGPPGKPLELSLALKLLQSVASPHELRLRSSELCLQPSELRLQPSNYAYDLQTSSHTSTPPQGTPTHTAKYSKVLFLHPTFK